MSCGRGVRAARQCWPMAAPASAGHKGNTNLITAELHKSACYLNRTELSIFEPDGSLPILEIQNAGIAQEQAEWL